MFNINKLFSIFHTTGSANSQNESTNNIVAIYTVDAYTALEEVLPDDTDDIMSQSMHYNLNRGELEAFSDDAVIYIEDILNTHHIRYVKKIA